MPLNRRDFVRTLFVASQTAVAARLLTQTAAAADAPKSPAPATLNFAVIGDWGRHGRQDQMEVSHQMGLACAAANARFVISVGDNFYEHGVTSVTDPLWDQAFENVYTAPSLHVPWYLILGNHDYCGSCQAQLDYGKTHPRWVMPARYYKQVFPIDDATRVECFFIDTCPFIHEYKHNPEFTDVDSQDSAKQLDWLDRSLAASRAEWKFVFGHHPIYSSGLAHGNQPEMIEHLLPLLQKHGVHAYFAGHDHDLEHLKIGNLDLIVSGAGSEHRPMREPATSPFSKACSGFAMVALTAQELQLRMIDNLGATLYTAQSTRPAKA